MKVFFNGEFLPFEQVRISPEDRGYVFGDGIYEIFRIYQGRLFEPRAHMDRLLRSAAQTRIELPDAPSEFLEHLTELAELNGMNEGTLYVQLTRGIAPRKHTFPEHAKTVVYASCNEVQRPHAAMRDGITAISRPDIRWLRCDIKSLNLLPNVLYKQEAVEAGAGEVLMHRGELVTECSAANAMMVEGGTLYTHPANQLILHGVTRALTLRMAERAGLAVRETARTLTDFRMADEVFATGTTVEITPIVGIDGRPVADGKPGPWTRRLQKEFGERIGK